MGAVWAILLRIHAIAGPVLSVLYPMVSSVKAIESPNKEDDEQWLTYWILYSLITLFETVAAPAISWFPLWYPLKLAILCWLVLPQFKGASFVYDQLVRKYVVNNKNTKEYFKSKSNDVMSPETKASVEKFVKENGVDSLDKLLGAIPRASTNKESFNKESQERY